MSQRSCVAAGHADVLILGQGLAGSSLAWRLAERGVSALVVDRGGVDEAGRPSASRIAAGLITPVTGRRLSIADNWEAASVDAVRFYRAVERTTGRRLLSARPALRLLASAEERERLRMRQSSEYFARQARPAAARQLPALLRAPHGGFWMPAAARLDAAGYLAATRRWLRRNGRWRQADIDLRQDIDLHGRGVRIPRLRLAAGIIALCQGADPTRHGGPIALPLEPVKGEVLRVAAPTLGLGYTLHRGVWLAPDGGGGEYLLGATHAWGDLSSTPTAAGRVELLSGVAAAITTPPTVLRHDAAIRPATADRKPVAGITGTRPRVAWLNGLGSKGALWAPWHAARLAEEIARVRR